MKKFLLFLPLLLGCSEYQVQEADSTEHVVCMTFDATPSFTDKTDEAFSYCGQVMKQFTRDTAGSNTRVVISQISSDAVLFNGSPRTFSQRFPTKERFKESLATPKDSRVYGSMADAIEKLCQMHREHPGMRSCFICLSDLGDNASGKEDWNRLNTALSEYARFGGVVALHWVDDEQTAKKWREVLKVAKFRSSVVTSRIDSDPPVPRF